MSSPASADEQMSAARAAWARLREVESVTVTVVVDNETDGLSTPCRCCDPALDPTTPTPYMSEFTAGVQRVTSGSQPCLDFRSVLLAGHGLSLLVEVTASAPRPPGRRGHTARAQGDSEQGQLRRPSLGAAGAEAGAEAEAGVGAEAEAESSGEVAAVLFDGGPSEELWRGNAGRLGLQLDTVGGAVLSHWHVDHSVGLAAVAEAASRARSAGAAAATAATAAATATATDDGASQPRGSTPPSLAEPPNCQQPGGDPAPFVFDVHPDRPLRRGLMLAPGAKPVPFNEDVSWAALSLPGCVVERHREPHTLLGDLFFVSGAIPRTSGFEAGQPGHATQGPDGVWRLDPLILDERYLAVRVRGQGAVVFSSCSHAGVVNVVSHVKEVSQGPVFGVVGGFHLASRPMEARVPETVAELRRLAPARIVVGHCTGWRAKAALAAAFPDTYQPCVVGGTYRFLAPPASVAEQPPA